LLNLPGYAPVNARFQNLCFQKADGELTTRSRTFTSDAAAVAADRPTSGGFQTGSF
jgi:hypothetical protein